MTSKDRAYWAGIAKTQKGKLKRKGIWDRYLRFCGERLSLMGGRRKVKVQEDPGELELYRKWVALRSS